MKRFLQMTVRSRLLLSLGLLVLVGIVVFATHAPAAASGESVTIRDDMIVIHPGAKIDKADVKALNKVLSKYDKSLYKIQTYRGGKVVRTQGKLADMSIDKAIASEAAQAVSSGSSDRTLQITTPAVVGSTTNPERVPGTTTNPQTTPGTTTNPQTTPGTTTNPQRTPGTTTNPQQTPGATTNPQQHSPSPVGAQASRELIERLKPILEKYSKK